MFYKCSSLLSIKIPFEWNTMNINDMSYMFYECESLISLPDLSKWNTSKVTNMYHMIYGFINCMNIISKFVK